MRHTTSSTLIPVLRRRTRVVALCTLILVVIAFPFFYADPSSSHEHGTFRGNDHQRLSRYLEVVTPWAKPKPTQTAVNEEFVKGQLEAHENQAIPDIQPLELAEVEDDIWELEEEYIDEEPNNLPKHIFNSNGLLTTNPKGVHPIYDLTRRAKIEWNRKHQRASKTLRQAVKEYKRRYGRSPPKGFNHWWDYVQKHDIQLPDEYDQIYLDLEPYWGVHPEDLQELQLDWEAHQDTYTIGKLSEDSIVTVLNFSISEQNMGRLDDFLSYGAKAQSDLLGDVYQYIPPFRATFSPHDNPNELQDWAWRKATTEAAKNGAYVRMEDLPPQERTGWSVACPRDSPLYMNPPDGGDNPKPQTEKTFIFDHRAAMDPCYHPQLISMHASLVSWGAGPAPDRFPSPQLSNCATLLHADIRATSLAQAAEFSEDDPRWEDKDDDRLFWRGTPTGMWHHDGVNWRQSHRVRLVNYTGAIMDRKLLDPNSDFYYVSFLRPTESADIPVGEPESYARYRLNDAFMDVSFVSPVSGCEGTVCDVFAQELPWGERVEAGPRGAGRYKYLFDVDGNGWSSRFRRLISSHSLVFKSTIYPEWWLDRVQPWLHYVPIQLDYSDLYDSLVFFAGDQSGEGAHEDMAKEIAFAGRDWARRYWRDVDVTAYMFRLWLEYARVMSLNRDEMSYTLP